MLARIVDAIAPAREDVIVEIGPGEGVLTRVLLERVPSLIAIEIDRDLAHRLGSEFPAERLTVHCADALEFDFSTLPLRARIVGNLPYNISTPLLIRLLDAPEIFGRLVLMLQREVAERIAAGPGSKTYGTLSVIVQLVASVRSILRVPASAFTPRPKVDSTVLVIDPFVDRLPSEEERRAVRRVVRTTFSQRRKQLVNSLAPLTPEPEKVRDRVGIDRRRRPETLSVEDFRSLAGALEPAAG